MRSATVNSSKKAVRDFIKKHNPYVKPKPLGVDLRAFLEYVDEYHIDKSTITPELVQRFGK